METALGDAAVWIFNRTSRILRSQDSADGLGNKLPTEIRRELTRRAGKYVTGKSTGAGVVSAEPERLSQRLVAQQGTFLMPTDASRPFEANLAAALGLEKGELGKPDRVSLELLDARRLKNLTADLIKVVLPRSIHQDARDDLWRMNISAATLFPGLDGFARSLGYYIQTAEKVVRYLGESDE